MATQTALGIFLYSFTNSFLFAFSASIAGILIDLDHLVDYYAHYGFTLNMTNIYNRLYKRKVDRFFLLLHSLEAILILWFVIYSLNLNNLWLAIAIGITLHILFDLFTNPMRLSSYFLACRIARGFKKDKLLKPNLN